MTEGKLKEQLWGRSRGWVTAAPHRYFRTADVLVAELLVTWLSSLKNAHKSKWIGTNEPRKRQSCSWGKAVHLETWIMILECCLRTFPVDKTALLNPVTGSQHNFVTEGRQPCT